MPDPEIVLNLNGGKQALPTSGGFILADRTLTTSVLRVCAAGDIRAGSTKQLAAAIALQIRYHLQPRDR
jgi:thioredoxin reductase